MGSVVIAKGVREQQNKHEGQVEAFQGLDTWQGIY